MSSKLLNSIFDDKKVYVDETFMDIIPWFLNNRKEDLLKTIGFLESLNFEQIQRMGHRWKGTCASYGFQKLSEAGEAMETWAENKKHDEIENLLMQVEQYIEHLEIVYIPTVEDSDSLTNTH